MKQNRIFALGMAILMLAGFAGNALATDYPASAVVIERVFNDSPFSILTVDNNFTYYIDINDECFGPLGWGNLHIWRFSADGTTPMEFDNADGFSFHADVTVDGTADGEAGLNLSPWWSSEVDGRFHLRTSDGEVACWGGRLPFYSFTGEQGVTYVKGTTVRLGIIYRTNQDMDTMPATVEYTYDGYTSGELPFDEGNPAEDPPHGVWGILTPAYAGGFLMFGNMFNYAEGDNLHVRFECICFQDMGTVVGTENSCWGSVKALYKQ